MYRQVQEIARRTSNRKSFRSTSSSFARGFLGQPVSVAQRWAKTGMPVTRQGRFVTASPDGSNEWLGRESGTGPVHVVTPQTDLSAELKRGLSYCTPGAFDWEKVLSRLGEIRKVSRAKGAIPPKTKRPRLIRVVGR
jgi:hypothetical protein